MLLEPRLDGLDEGDDGAASSYLASGTPGTTKVSLSLASRATADRSVMQGGEAAMLADRQRALRAVPPEADDAGAVRESDVCHRVLQGRARDRRA